MFYYTYGDAYISSVRSSMSKLLEKAGVKYQNYDANGNQTTQTEQVTTALAIPDWIYNAFIPLGAFLMVIHTAERILDGIGELKTLHGADKPEGGDAA